MKQAFRFPLWLVPICWLGSVILGSAFELLLVRELLHDNLNNPLVFYELAIKSAIVASPVLICALAAAFAMNRYPRGVWKYAAGFSVIQLLFGYLSMYMTVVPGTDFGMPVYTPGFVVEEVGFLLPMLLYSAGGCIVHGVAFLLIRRHVPQKQETIDQTEN